MWTDLLSGEAEVTFYFHRKFSRENATRNTFTSKLLTLYFGGLKNSMCSVTVYKQG
jgi:hypothetical protein